MAWLVAMDQEVSPSPRVPPRLVNASSPRRRRSRWAHRSKRWFKNIPDRLAERKPNLYQFVVMIGVCYAVYRYIIPMFDRDMGASGSGGGGEG